MGDKEKSKTNLMGHFHRRQRHNYLLKETLTFSRFKKYEFPLHSLYGTVKVTKLINFMGDKDEKNLRYP
jgi:hypothetical protein